MIELQIVEGALVRLFTTLAFVGGVLALGACGMAWLMQRGR